MFLVLHGEGPPNGRGGTPWCIETSRGWVAGQVELAVGRVRPGDYRKGGFLVAGVGTERFGHPLRGVLVR